MRTYKFKAKDAKIRDEFGLKLQEMVENYEAYKLRDIAVMVMDNGDEHYVGLIVADCVGAEFKFAFKDIVKDGKISSSVIMDSDLFAYELEIPKDVSVSIDWSKDGGNRYKTIRLNYDKIKEMARKGVNPEEISRTFGIRWSGDDSEWIIGRYD